MRVLGIETSCDETAAAIVRDGRYIESNVVASQVAVHAQYGGIVPEVASREHIRWIPRVIRQALDDAKVCANDIDRVAVTVGPGLAGSLLVGINAAKALAHALGKPLVPVNHLSGHVYAGWLTEEEVAPVAPEFPLLCLIVSGAHADLVLMTGHHRFERIARTRDDAPGEAFDKAARLLRLGYPGGPAIQKAAEAGSLSGYRLPVASVGDTLDFSFSGLKTALSRLVHADDQANVSDIAAAFQEAVVGQLVRNTVTAVQRTGAKQLVVGGGVAANRRLRERLVAALTVPVFWPEPKLCTDNAAMIAAAGFFDSEGSSTAFADIDVQASLKLGVRVTS